MLFIDSPSASRLGRKKKIENFLSSSHRRRSWCSPLLSHFLMKLKPKNIWSKTTADHRRRCTHTGLASDIEIYPHRYLAPCCLFDCAFWWRSPVFTTPPPSPLAYRGPFLQAWHLILHAAVTWVTRSLRATYQLVRHLWRGKPLEVRGGVARCMERVTGEREREKKRCHPPPTPSRHHTHPHNKQILYNKGGLLLSINHCVVNRLFDK